MAINDDPPDYQRLLEEDGGEDGAAKPKGRGGLFGGDAVPGATAAAAHVSIRLGGSGFIRKVLGILSIQLLFTTAVTAIFVYTPGLKGLVQQWSWMVLVAFVLSIGLLIAMMIKRKEYPLNFILLGAWTIVEAYTVGVLASFYDRDVVAQAVFLTAGVVLGLTLYTLQTKRDFSAMGSGLFACLFILIIGGFLQMFLMNETLDFLLAMGGAVIFSLFIIYDLQNLIQRTDPGTRV